MTRVNASISRERCLWEKIKIEIEQQRCMTVLYLPPAIFQSLRMEVKEQLETQLWLIYVMLRS